MVILRRPGHPVSVVCGIFLTLLLMAHPLTVSSSQDTTSPGVRTIQDMLIGEWRSPSARLVFHPDRRFTVSTQEGTTAGTFRLLDAHRLQLSPSAEDGSAMVLLVRRISGPTLHLQTEDGRSGEFESVGNRSRWHNFQYQDGRVVRGDGVAAARAPHQASGSDSTAGSSRPTPSVLDLLVGGEWRGQGIRLVFHPSGQLVRIWSDSTRDQGTFTLSDARRLDIFMKGQHFPLSIRHISARVLRTQPRDQPNASVRYYNRTPSQVAGSPWADVWYDDGQLRRSTRQASSAKPSAGETAFQAAVLGMLLGGILYGLSGDAGTAPPSTHEREDDKAIRDWQYWKDAERWRERQQKPQ